MPYGIIYLVTNLVNGKYYVGQTTCPLKVRWTQHLSDAARRPKHLYLHRAISKYGVEHFTCVQIDEADSPEALNIKESEHIARLNSCVPSVGYNRTYGGDNGVIGEVRERIRQSLKGRKWTRTPEQRAAAIARLLAIPRPAHHSPERRAKISASLTGLVRSEESKAKQSASARGKKRAPFTPEHIENMRKASTGRVVSEETRERIRVAATGRKFTPEQIQLLRRIQQERAKTLSPEQREWMAVLGRSNKGKKMDPEAVARGAATRTGRHQTPEHYAAIAAGKRAARERRLQAQGQESLWGS